MITQQDIDALHAATSEAVSNIRFFADQFPSFTKEEVESVIRFADYQRRSLPYHTQLMQQVAPASSQTLRAA